MNGSYLIKSALLSEKSYKQMEKGIYTFLVEKHINKKLIAKTIEEQFGVKVVKVNISKKTAKTKRIQRSRKTTKVPGAKKAIVYLKSGQSIEMLSPAAKSKKKKDKGTTAQPKEVKTKEAELTKNQKKTQTKGLLSRIRKSK